MKRKVDVQYPYSKGKWKGEIWLRDQDLKTIDDSTIRDLEDLARRLSGHGESKPGAKSNVNIAPFIKNRSQTHQALSIVNYLYNNGTESVTAIDLDEQFKKLHLPKPGNLHDVLNRLILRGFVMEADPKENKKAWSITQLGIEFVERKILNKQEG